MTISQLLKSDLLRPLVLGFLIGTAGVVTAQLAPAASAMEIVK